MTDTTTSADHLLARTLHRHLTVCGGFTLDRRSHRPLAAGVSVGADPSATLHLPWAHWDDALVACWLRRHRERRRHEDLHLGGWLDPLRAEVWLDLVRVFPRHARDEALEVGRRHRQRAVFDIGARTVWYLTGLTATATAAAGLAPTALDPLCWTSATGTSG